jgi:hypothetical protein
MNNKSTIAPLARALRALFIPDIGELVLVLMLSAFIYGAVSFNYWLAILTHNDKQLEKYSYELISSSFDKLDTLPHAASIISAVLWAVAGMALYMALVVVTYFFITTKNNTDLNKPLMNKPLLLFFFLADEYRRVVWITIAVILIGISVFIFFPLWLSYFAAFNESRDVLSLLAALLGLSYNLYLLFSSLVIAYRNPKILY